MSNPPTTPNTVDMLDLGIGNVLFDTWLVSRAVSSLIDDVIKSTGLDADEFGIYSVLARDDGMTPSELSGWMSAPATTVSSYVKRFEKRGHVDRVPSIEDRRSYRLVLTAEGRATHRAAGELFQPTLAEVDEALGKQGPNLHLQLLELRRVIDAVAAD
ncbi:MAG: MarR family winged helix-turn-helix transcriptional regulator [Acidimicrobiales bacterium]